MVKKERKKWYVKVLLIIMDKVMINVIFIFYIFLFKCYKCWMGIMGILYVKYR